MSAVAALVGCLASSSAVSGIILNPGTASSFGSGSRTATYRANSDGFIYHGDNAVFTQQYQWEQSASAPSAFEIRADVTTGSVSGTTGSWLGLGTTRDWSVTEATVSGGNLATITVQIRNASTLVVVATATIELYAERVS